MVRIAFAALLLAISALAPFNARDAAECGVLTAANTADCVRLNQIQVLGTHNSYHIAPVPQILAAIGAEGRDLEYTHRPLVEQLSELGIRQFELDVFADPEGGRYATPLAYRLLGGVGPLGPEMLEPGFKVLHTQDVDFRSRCYTLKACLTIIRDWSREHPQHVPIQIQIEAKDTPASDRIGLPVVQPLPIGPDELRALDAEIRSVFDDDHLITPDRVRGSHATLADAIKADGWPTLRASRGKVLFALDNTDQHRVDYLIGNPSLEKRVLFVSSRDGDPSAAFIKMNEPDGAREEAIRQSVRSGFLIRTRADSPTIEARTGNTARRDAAFRSGAQYVSTDYPEESPFGSGYRVLLPATAPGLPARCNPVNAPVGCRDEWLEPR